MNLDFAAFYWIKEHLQSQDLDIWMHVLTSKNTYLIPGICTVLAILGLKRKRGLIFLITAILTVGVADLLVNSGLKPLFARVRPCHELDFLDMAVYCSGTFSFPSSQATNAFALATVWALFFRGSGYGMFPLAGIMALSRVYLGVHYLSDVLAGALCGTITGYVGFKTSNFLTIAMTPQTLASKKFPPAPNILIIKLSSLGDVIHSLPALRTLRVRFPSAHITWVVEEKCKDLLFNNPDIDELIVVRIRHWRRNWNTGSFRELKHALKQLRGRKFDVVLDLQGLIKTGIISFLTGASVRVGFHRKDCREQLNAWLNNLKIPYIGKQTHVIDKNLAMIRYLGASDPIYAFPLVIPEDAEARVREYLESQPGLTAQPMVAIHQGVGFETKRWELERFAALGDRIADELGVSVLLTWGPGEETRVQQLSALMRRPHWVAPANSMHQTMALIRRLRLFIGCDTGPMHLAAALGVPTVSLFGPTDPAYSRPHGDSHVVVCKPQPCSFCHRRSCPTHNECMTAITVDDAFQAVREVLKLPSPPEVSWLKWASI